MILFPPAKINLGLNIISKREDGFHEIESCLLSISITDVLEIIPQDSFEFNQSGLQIEGDIESNLCVRAFRLIKEKYNVSNVSIHLIKNIPMGAGLGGGSADAAYVIRGLNSLFSLEISIDEMNSLAAELGSDCAFFISDGSKIARGRGEILSEFKLNLTGYYLKIINPEIHIGTAEAYKNVPFPEIQHSINEILNQSIYEWKGQLKNDFEDSIFPNYPEIKLIKDRLYQEGAIYASMSGSGSTVYGIFKNSPDDVSNYNYTRILKL